MGDDRERPVQLEFIYDDGETITVGSRQYSNNLKTFEVPIHAQLRALTAWSGGWLLDGVQFHYQDRHGFNQLQIKRVQVISSTNTGAFMYAVFPDEQTTGILVDRQGNLVNVPEHQIDFQNLEVRSCRLNDLIIASYCQVSRNLEYQWFPGKQLWAILWSSRNEQGDIQRYSTDRRNCKWWGMRSLNFRIS